MAFRQQPAELTACCLCRPRLVKVLARLLEFRENPATITDWGQVDMVAVAHLRLSKRFGRREMSNPRIADLLERQRTLFDEIFGPGTYAIEDREPHFGIVRSPALEMGFAYDRRDQWVTSTARPLNVPPTGRRTQLSTARRVSRRSKCRSAAKAASTNARWSTSSGWSGRWQRQSLRIRASLGMPRISFLAIAPPIMTGPLAASANCN